MTPRMSNSINLTSRNTEKKDLETSLRTAIVGFVDVDFRCYTYQGGNDQEFFDETGEFYVLDKSGKGYFDSQRNHFIFDDCRLRNGNTPLSKKLIKDFFMNNCQAESNPVNHPIKRLVIVSAEDFDLPSDDEIGSCDTGVGKLDEYEKPNFRRDKKKPQPIRRRKTSQSLQVSSSLIEPEKAISKSIQFQTGDQEMEASWRHDRYFDLTNDFDHSKLIPEKCIKPMVNVHRQLAQMFKKMSVEDIIEVFMYIDEQGGRHVLEHFAKLLDNRPDSLMIRKQIVLPKSIPFESRDKPVVSVHRQLAQMISKMSVQYLKEVFLIFDKIDGRKSLVRFAKILDDYEMALNQNKAALKQDIPRANPADLYQFVGFSFENNE